MADETNVNEKPEVQITAVRKNSVQHTAAAPESALTPNPVSAKQRVAVAMLFLLGVASGIAIIVAPPSMSNTTGLSADRAAAHVKELSKAPRTLGSVHHEAARRYIVGELEKIGITPTEDDATTALARRPWWVSVVRVRNIIAKVTGHDPAATICVVSHYDSAVTSPGAYDSGVAVAAMLEALRVLKSGPPLRNDVIFLFTDGEESGLMGARAFVENHPLGSRPGIVLNFDARGRKPPLLMFEAGSKSGSLVGELARASTNIITSSAVLDLASFAGHATDFQIFKEAGWQGLNFAYIRDGNEYHTSNDRYDDGARLPAASQVELIVEMVNRFGNSEGFPESDIKVLFPLPLIGIVSYSHVVGALVLGVTAIAFVILSFTAIRLRLTSWRRLTAASVVLPFLLGVVVVGVLILQAVLQTGSDGFFNVHGNDGLVAGVYLGSFALLSVIASLILLSLVSRKIGEWSVALGACGWWLIAAAAVDQISPASYLFLWPVVFAVAGLYLRAWATKSSRDVRTVGHSIVAVPAMIITMPIIYLAAGALPIGVMPVFMAFIAAMTALFFPQLNCIADWSRFRVAVPAAGAAIVSVMLPSFLFGFGDSFPQTGDLFYALNEDEEKALWVSSIPGARPWKVGYFDSSVQTDPLTSFFPNGGRTYYVSVAPRFATDSPRAELVSEGTENGERLLTLRIAGAAAAGGVSVYLDRSSKIVLAEIVSRQFKPPTDWNGDWQIDYAGGYPFPMEMKLTAAGPVKLRIVQFSQEWPSHAPAVRLSPNLVPGFYGIASTRFTTKSFSF